MKKLMVLVLALGSISTFAVEKCKIKKNLEYFELLNDTTQIDATKQDRKFVFKNIGLDACKDKAKSLLADEYAYKKYYSFCSFGSNCKPDIFRVKVKSVSYVYKKSLFNRTKGKLTTNN
ncbi:MAG: hypothetical protein QE271_02410 [Bacteriovoracaceae bacterium]|nr:hypothetical protein [Bacteriovoracaceae bacterium]